MAPVLFLVFAPATPVETLDAATAPVLEHMPLHRLVGIEMEKLGEAGASPGLCKVVHAMRDIGGDAPPFAVPGTKKGQMAGRVKALYQLAHSFTRIGWSQPVLAENILQLIVIFRNEGIVARCLLNDDSQTVGSSSTAAIVARHPPKECFHWLGKIEFVAGVAALLEAAAEGVFRSEQVIGYLDIHAAEIVKCELFEGLQCFPARYAGQQVKSQIRCGPAWKWAAQYLQAEPLD